MIIIIIAIMIKTIKCNLNSTTIKSWFLKFCCQCRYLRKNGWN